jgi:LysM repeat protein
VPSPTQAGITTGCTKYVQAQSGDFCFKFAQDNNITPDQLYTWNTILGTSGSNCNTQFFLGYYYCVAGPSLSTSAAPTSTSSAPATPSPTQPGISANCNKYMIAKSGDYCYKFAQDNGISTDNLYAWNTVLGSGGSNCGTKFFLGYYYCIGVSN